METLISITNILVLGLIISAPIFILIILKRFDTKRTLIIYSLISLFILAVLILIFAWWVDKSSMILLDHYGYNYNGFNDFERFQNVAQENLDKAKSLETRIMGIGWPVKAIFGYIILIPYLVFVYIGKILHDRLKKNKNEA